MERSTLSSVLDSVPVDADCLGVIQYLNNREVCDGLAAALHHNTMRFRFSDGVLVQVAMPE